MICWQGFDYTSIEDLQLAIEECKYKVLESEENSETRRQLVEKLVELRLRLAETKVCTVRCVCAPPRPTLN